MDAAGVGVRYVTLDKDLMSIPDLGLFEKVVLAFFEQHLDVEDVYEECAVFFRVKTSDVKSAVKTLRDLGYLEDNDE